LEEPGRVIMGSRVCECGCRHLAEHLPCHVHPECTRWRMPEHIRQFRMDHELAEMMDFADGPPRLSTERALLLLDLLDTFEIEFTAETPHRDIRPRLLLLRMHSDAGSGDMAGVIITEIRIPTTAWVIAGGDAAVLLTQLAVLAVEQPNFGEVIRHSLVAADDPDQPLLAIMLLADAIVRHRGDPGAQLPGDLHPARLAIAVDVDERQYLVYRSHEDGAREVTIETADQLNHRVGETSFDLNVNTTVRDCLTVLLRSVRDGR